MNNNSFTLIKLNLIIAPDLDVYEFRILSYLIYCSNERICFPGYDDLNKKTGISKSVIQNRIEQLEAKGYIRKLSNKGHKNKYEINERCFVQQKKEKQEIFSYDWLGDD